jgi:hypothetical protein
MAERVGFEPTLEFPLNTLSKRAPSATRPSLRRIGWDNHPVGQELAANSDAFIIAAHCVENLSGGWRTDERLMFWFGTLPVHEETAWIQTRGLFDLRCQIGSGSLCPRTL